MKGVYIYIKTDSIPYDFYNVIGSYGTETTASDGTILIETPVIEYNGAYYALTYDSSTSLVTLSLVESSNVNLHIYTDTYYTVVKSNGVLVKVITNDHPINTSLALSSDCEARSTYLLYTITVTESNKTAIIERESTIYDNGYAIAKVDSSDDTTVDTTESLSILITPLYALLKSLQKFTLSFSKAVIKGPQYSTSSATLLRNDGSGYAVTSIAFSSISLSSDGVTTLDVNFENNITDEGNYAFYIPSGVFLYADTGTNLNYVNKCYSIIATAEGDTVSYTLSPSTGDTIKTFTITFNKTIKSINTRDTRGFGLYKVNGTSSTLIQGIYGDDIQYTSGDSVITLTFEEISNQTSEAPGTYYIGTYGTGDLIVFTLGTQFSAADYTTAASNFGTFTLTTPEVVTITGLSITGPESISTISTFTYKPTYSPSHTTLKGVTWSLENNAYATIESLSDGTVKLTSTNLPEKGASSETYKLTATSTVNSSIIATKNITFIYSDAAVVEVTGISIKYNGNSNIIDTTGRCSFTAVLSPSNTTLNTVNWSLQGYGTSDDITLVGNDLNATLEIKNLPSKDTNIIISASCENADIADATYSLTITNGIIALEAITITGDSTISATGNYGYNTVLSPSNTSQTGISWVVISNNATISSTGVLTVNDAALEEGSIVVQARSTENSNIYASKTITLIGADDKPSSEVKVTEITISGSTSISQTGAYLYTASFIPSNTTLNTVAWTISSGAYSGVSINSSGLLNVLSLPINQTTIKVKAISLDNSSVSKELSVTLLASNSQSDGLQYTISTDPSSGKVSSISGFKLIFTGSSITSISLSQTLSNITVTSTASNFLTSSLSCSGSVDFKQNGSQWYNNYVFGTTYTAEGTYTITIPSGIFLLNSEYPNKTFTIVYKIRGTLETVDPSEDAEKSDDGTVNVGGLFTYATGTECFRAPMSDDTISDTIIVKQTLNNDTWTIPNILLNPNIYYTLDNTNYSVNEGTASITYSYMSDSGYKTDSENITYGTGYNLTTNIFNSIEDLRDITLGITVGTNNFTLFKKVKFVFVDPDAYSELKSNINYTLTNVTVDSSTYELQIPVYGCLEKTGHEVIVTNGEEYECELNTNTKVRLGNINNVYNELFGKKLPSGYGLYSENVYLTGEFVLSNGKTLVDISDEVNILSGDIARALALLDKTKTNILNDTKSNLANLANKLTNNFKLNQLLKSRIDNIANDGIISKDEKNDLLDTWKQCINNFYAIEAIINDLADDGKLANSDVSYDSLKVANNNYRKSFFDINELISEFILNEDTWDEDIYDYNGGSNDIYTYLGLTYRSSLYPTITSTEEDVENRNLDNSTITYSNTATNYERLELIEEGEDDKIYLTKYKSYASTTEKIFQNIYKDYSRQVDIINNQINTTLGEVIKEVNQRVINIGLDGLIAREEKADLYLDWLTVKESYESIIKRIENLYDLVYNPDNDYTITVDWDALEAVETIFGNNFIILSALLSYVLADITTDTTAKDIIDWGTTNTTEDGLFISMSRYVPVRTKKKSEEVAVVSSITPSTIASNSATRSDISNNISQGASTATGLELEETSESDLEIITRIDAVSEMLRAYLAAGDTSRPAIPESEDLYSNSATNDYHFNNFWGAYKKSLEDILEALLQVGNDMTLDLTSSINDSVHNITIDNIITSQEISELLSDKVLVTKEKTLFITKYKSVKLSAIEDYTTALASLDAMNGTAGTTISLTDYVTDNLVEKYCTYLVWAGIFESFAILANNLRDSTFTEDAYNSIEGEDGILDSNDESIPFSLNIVLVYDTNNENLYKYLDLAATLSIDDIYYEIPSDIISTVEVIDPTMSITTISTFNNATTTIYSSINAGEITGNADAELADAGTTGGEISAGGTATYNSGTKSLDISLDNLYLLWDKYSQAKDDLILAFADNNASILKKDLAVSRETINAKVDEEMGENRDYILHEGLDYAMWALGSAGIAITNPDAQYLVNGRGVDYYITLAGGDEKLGYLDYINAVSTADSSALEVDIHSVGDGDEQLRLYGDKVMVLTTDTGVYDPDNAKIKVYKVRLNNITSYTRSNGVSVALTTTEDKEFYISEVDLHSLSGVLEDYIIATAYGNEKVQEYTGTTTEDDTTAVSRPYRYLSTAGTKLNLYKKNATTKVILYMGYCDVPTGDEGIKLTILYTKAALFEGGRLNADLIQTSSLEVGTFDTNGYLITDSSSSPFTRAYSKTHYNSSGEVDLEAGILQAYGAQLQGALTVGDTSGAGLYLGYDPSATTLDTDHYYGLFIRNSSGIYNCEFSAKQKLDPLAEYTSVSDSNLVLSSDLLLTVNISGLTSEDSGYYYDKFLQFDSSDLYTRGTDTNTIIKPLSDFNLNVSTIIEADSTLNDLELTAEPDSIILNVTKKILLYKYSDSSYTATSHISSQTCTVVYSKTEDDEYACSSNDDSSYPLVLLSLENISLPLTEDSSNTYYAVRVIIDVLFVTTGTISITGGMPGYKISNIIHSNTLNNYKASFFGNGISLGYNKKNYFGAYFNTGTSYMSFDFRTNNYGMKFASNKISQIFNGEEIDMPYVIYYGYVNGTAENNLSITTFGGLASMKSNARVERQNTGKYRIYFTTLPYINETLQIKLNSPNVFITVTGTRTTGGSGDHTCYCTVKYRNEKSFTVFTADDSTVNDGDFSIKIEYFVSGTGSITYETGE